MEKSIKNCRISWIDFGKGFNVLVGETGAGKSIIFDSLNFVLGSKADKTLISYGENLMKVDASFSFIGQNIKDFLVENRVRRLLCRNNRIFR